jgi:hypothetical protein
MADHAVVIGGSIAGLISARVLSDYFDKVTVLERDQIDDRPVIHKSVPQGNQFHALLQGGQRVLATLYGIYQRSSEISMLCGSPRYRLVPSRRQSLTKFRPSKSVRAPGGHGLSRRARQCEKPHLRLSPRLRRAGPGS